MDLAAFAPDLGDVPGWLGVLFSGTAATLAFLGWNRESAGRREDAARQRRAQARLVQLHVIPRGSGGTLGAVWDLDVDVQAENASDEPLPDATVLVHIVCDDPLRQHEVSPAGARVAIGTVPARSTRTMTARFRVPSEAPGGMIAVSVAAVIEFTDQAGTRWQRDRDGVLSEITDRP